MPVALHTPTMRLLGCPTSQRLTFRSSPPVTSVRPYDGLSATHVTLEAWATNSAVGRRGEMQDKPAILTCIVMQ